MNKADRNTGFVHLQAVPNPLAPKSCLQHNPVQDEPNEHKYVAEACALHPDADSYYPKVGGLRKPTLCSGEDTDCSKAIICNSDPEAHFDKPVAEANCTVTAIDRYTSSFNFTETNFGAIWLRPQWYLMINSVLTDIQNGGVTFVTGGGYTASDVIHGHWALARKNVFIGQTQPVPGQPPPSEANPYVSAAGPVNPKGLTCDKNADGSPTGNYCLVAEEGISYPLSSFGLNQRFFNIYDGPAYQEANAYLNIKQTPITDCSPADSPRICFDSRFMYGRVVGMPQDDHGVCYLPNAAIAWKQPNGFYYPPAFHSRNLYFDQDVDIRHFVIEPLFKPGTFQTNDTCRQGDGDAACVKNRYCTWVPTMFDNFTDIDRQTELNDDDGSLTGYVNTISVNEDHFFNAPIEAFECDSDLTAKTSPYDYVTTVVYPGCVAETEVARKCPTLPWGSDCGGPHCYGVPMYRQWLTREENESTDTVIKNPTIRLAGQGNFQRSTLSVNHGKYYIDTAVSEATQRAQPRVSSLNVFKENRPTTSSWSSRRPRRGRRTSCSSAPTDSTRNPRDRCGWCAPTSTPTRTRSSIPRGTTARARIRGREAMTLPRASSR